MPELHPAVRPVAVWLRARLLVHAARPRRRRCQLRLLHHRQLRVLRELRLLRELRVLC